MLGSEHEYDSVDVGPWHSLICKLDYISTCSLTFPIGPQLFQEAGVITRNILYLLSLVARGSNSWVMIPTPGPDKLNIIFEMPVSCSDMVHIVFKSEIGAAIHKDLVGLIAPFK